MKRIILCFALFWIFSSTFAQRDIVQSSFSEGENIFNQFGDFTYQYNRIVNINPENPLQVFITVVFINGNNQTAITYRQDAVKGNVEWIKSENGTLRKEGFVEAITASVPPNHVISWKYSYTLKEKPKKKNIVDVDKAALMIMNDNFEVVKKYFKANEFKVR